MPNNKPDFTIAVIASGIDEEYQQSILRGIHRYAAQHQVNIAHFIAFGGILSNPDYDQGEYNIFELPEFSKFDGAILLSNTFSGELAESLYQKIQAAGIPAVSIDRELGDFYHIGIHNATAMEQIIRHMIEKHGVKRLNFISGPDDNTENMERFAAYTKVLQEYHIPLEPERVYHGTFRAKDGRRAVKYFMQSQLEFPQAIICANDTMAISAVIAMEEQGICVPDDVLVSGFDNIYNARHFSPALTTVERPLMQSGALACELICRHCAGEELERVHQLNAVPIFSESCGCSESDGEDITVYKKHSYQRMEATARDISRHNQMACALVACDTFDQYIRSLKQFVLKAGCEEFYLCLNDNWHTKQIHHENGYTGVLPSETYTTKGYCNRMQMPIAYYDGRFHNQESFTSDDILPRLRIESDRVRKMYFIPLHFREHCMGYFVIVNSEFPLSSAMFHAWSISISNSLENFRKLLCLDEVVQELDKLYAIDSLTGIYNRNGFKRSSGLIFRKCIEEQRTVMVMFADMDGLKSINDNFGHKAGDHAIRSIATILQEACLDDEITCRFGGDEFFIFGVDYSEEKAVQLRNRIQRALDICNQHSGREYQLSVSLGACITVPKPDSTVFQLITIADNKMYEEKKKKSLSKYLKQGNCWDTPLDTDNR
ncbi:MAG: GGDEF domain-containing protein [Oscillospiraceae bacterium]|nr:GGDEF domain-containing protein [Oscillospiraceae bacterium]